MKTTNNVAVSTENDTTDKPKKCLPTIIFVGGIPFEITTPVVVEHGPDLAYASSLCTQKIEVIEDAPFPRRLAYAMQEVSRLLLDAAGYTGSKAVAPFGSVLYRLIRENSFAWLYENADAHSVPSTVFINGMPYVVTQAEDKHLDDKDLLGEVSYIQLSIRLHSDMKQETRDVVFLHEVAHAMLYEAQCTTIHNKESLVEPLSHLLYQLFKQNDFSFAYNG